MNANDKNVKKDDKIHQMILALQNWCDEKGVVHASMRVRIRSSPSAREITVMELKMMPVPPKPSDQTRDVYKGALEEDGSEIKYDSEKISNVCVIKLNDMIFSIDGTSDSDVCIAELIITNLAANISANSMYYHLITKNTTPHFKPIKRAKPTPKVEDDVPVSVLDCCRFLTATFNHAPSSYST